MTLVKTTMLRYANTIRTSMFWQQSWQSRAQLASHYIIMQFPGKCLCPVNRHLLFPAFNAHNFTHSSSCIIVSCLLVAAGPSQWPRYNQTLWSFCCWCPLPLLLLFLLILLAACSAPTLPPATSLHYLSLSLSLPSLHDPHLHGNQFKMASRKRRLSVDGWAIMTRGEDESGWEWI